MFSSAKPSFCSNFQTYKKKSFEKNINPFFFQLKNWPVHFPLDLHQIGFLCLQNRNQIGHKSFCKWQNILDDGYEFQIKRLLGLRNSKIKQKCLWNVKQHAQMAKSVKKCNIGGCTIQVYASNAEIIRLNIIFKRNKMQSFENS